MLNFQPKHSMRLISGIKFAYDIIKQNNEKRKEGKFTISFGCVYVMTDAIIF